MGQIGQNIDVLLGISLEHADQPVALLRYYLSLLRYLLIYSLVERKEEVKL